MSSDPKKYFIARSRFRYLSTCCTETDLSSWSRSVTVYFWIVSLSDIVSSSSASLCSTASSSSAWKLIAEKECQRLLDQQTRLLAIYDSNEKEDTTSWLNRNKWPKLFVGKDLKVATFRYFLFLSMKLIQAHWFYSVPHDRFLEFEESDANS